MTDTNIKLKIKLAERIDKTIERGTKSLALVLVLILLIVLSIQRGGLI